jgi:membrane-bound lytic murein transglycosylase A
MPRQAAAPAAAASAPATAAAAPASAPVSSVTLASDLGNPFATRYASFQPVSFDAIPGWNTDNLLESLEVFQRSCTVLAKKPAWTDTCAALTHADADSTEDARRFYETHFHAYQVFNLDNTADGLITGYYEPQLHGSRTRTAQYRYPVYGLPRDLYQLDARSLSGAARQWFSIDGRRLRAAAPGSPGASEYQLALGDDMPDLADKRYRVRIDGTRIVPYWSRQQIEQHGVDAPVLAWVDDAWALYSMQIQGTGRIALADGGELRLAYSGQNGHPFLPNASSHDTALVADAIKTRGLHVGGNAPASQAAGGNDDVAAIIARLKGNGAGAPARAGTPAPRAPAASAGSNDAAVQAMIDKLKGNGGHSAPTVAVTPTPATAATTTPQTARDPQVQAMIASLLGKAPPSTGAGTPSYASAVAAPAAATAPAGFGTGIDTGIGDPSYVFFREIDPGLPGPPGALGVPLTAGRSLAVDPRTTPLGAPVFVDTRKPRGTGDIERLMLAQDTGGAIRGSVRGDFFWGHGQQAGSMASAMNASGRMWLLLPKQLVLGALSPRVRTRSLGDIAAAPDCVIPDDESCVED